MQITDKFIESCEHADDFPTNLVRHETFVDYSLIDYHERLKDRSSELFSPEDKGCLRIWEYDDKQHSKSMLAQLRLLERVAN